MYIAYKIGKKIIKLLPFAFLAMVSVYFYKLSQKPRLEDKDKKVILFQALLAALLLLGKLLVVVGLPVMYKLLTAYGSMFI